MQEQGERLHIVFPVWHQFEAVKDRGLTVFCIINVESNIPKVHFNF